MELFKRVCSDMNQLFTFRLRGALLLSVVLGIQMGSVVALGAIEKTQALNLQGPDLLTRKKVEIQYSAPEKATVVVFLSANCPCSRSHEKTLQDLHKTFSGPMFQFIAVHSNADESWEFAKKYFETAKLPFPIVQDNGAVIADQLGAFKTPHVYVIGKNQEILFQGGVDDSHHAPTAKKHYLEEALTAIRDGVVIQERNVRVLGCAIKRP